MCNRNCRHACTLAKSICVWQRWFAKPSLSRWGYDSFLTHRWCPPVQTVPGPPSNVRVDTTTGQVSLTPPTSNGGSPITSYYVEAVPTGSSLGAATNPYAICTTTTCSHIPGLDSGTKYTVYARWARLCAQHLSTYSRPRSAQGSREAPSTQACEPVHRLQLYKQHTSLYSPMQGCQRCGRWSLLPAICYLYGQRGCA